MLPENYKRVLRELILPGLKILQENPRAVTLEIPQRGPIPIEVFEDLVKVSTPDRLKKLFRQLDVSNPTFLLALEGYITGIDKEDEKEQTLEGKSPGEIAEEVEIIAEATQKITQTNARKIEPFQDIYHKQIEAYNRFMQGFPDEMGARIAAYYGPKSSLPAIDQLSEAEINAITTKISAELKQKGPDFKTLGEIEHFINTASSELLTNSYRQKLANNLGNAEIEPEVQAVIDEKVEKAIASFKAGPTIADQAQKLHAIVQEKTQVEKKIHQFQSETIDRSVQLSRIIRKLPARFRKNPAFIQKLTVAISTSPPIHSGSPQRTLLETLVSTALEAEEVPTKGASPNISASLSPEDIRSLQTTAHAIEQSAPTYPISTTVSQVPPSRPTPKQIDADEKIVSESLKWAVDHPEPYAQHVIDDMYLQVEQSKDAIPQHTRKPITPEEIQIFVHALEDTDTLTSMKESPEGDKELLVSTLKDSLFVPSQKDYEALLVSPIVQSIASSLSPTTTEAQLQTTIKEAVASWSLPPEYKARITSSIINTVTQRVTTTLLPLTATLSQLPEEDNQSISSAVLIQVLKTHGVFVDDTTFIVKNVQDSGILSSVVGYLQDNSTYTQTMEHVVSELQKIIPSRLLPTIPENKAVLEAIAKDMLYRATAFPEVTRRLKSSSSEEQSEALQIIATDAYTTHYDDFFDSDYSHVAEEIVGDNWEPEEEQEEHTHHHSLPKRKKKPINRLIDRNLSILDHTKELWGEYGTTSFFFTQAATTRRGRVVGFFVDTLSIIPGFRETFLTLYFSFNEPGLRNLSEQIKRDQRLLQRRIDLLQSKGLKGRELEFEHLNLEYGKLTAQLKAITAIQDKGSRISRLNPLRALFNLWKKVKDPLQSSQSAPINIAVFQWLRRLPSQFSTFLERTPFKLSSILPRLSFLQLGLKRAFNPSLGIVATPNIFSLEFGLPKGLSAVFGYVRKILSVPFGFLRSNVGFLAGVRGFFLPRFKNVLSLASPIVPGLLSGFRTGVGALPIAVTTGGNNALIAFFTKKGQWLVFGFLILTIIIPMSTFLVNQVTTQTAMIEGSQIVMNAPSGPSGPSGPTGPIPPAPTPDSRGLVYYSQERNQQWWSHSMPITGCTIQNWGCGQTSTAMVLASWVSTQYNPINVADNFYYFNCGSSLGESRAILNGQRAGRDGTRIQGLRVSDYLTSGGESLDRVAQLLQPHIQQGAVVVAAADITWKYFDSVGRPATNTRAHIFLVVDVTRDDNGWHIWTYDPSYGHWTGQVPLDLQYELGIPFESARKRMVAARWDSSSFAVYKQ